MCPLEQWRNPPPNPAQLLRGSVFDKRLPPMWGAEPADQQVHLIKTQKMWSCLPASHTPCVCFISGHIACTERGKGHFHSNEALKSHCMDQAVETYSKTNCFYGSSQFPSQKVKHQKAAEWMTLTNAVNPNRGEPAFGLLKGWRGRWVRMEKDSWKGLVFSRAWAAESIGSETFGTQLFDEERKYSESA